MKNLKRLIISGIYKRIPTHYSDFLEQFIQMCLKVDPLNLPSAEELLKNAHFSGFDQDYQKTEFKLLDKIYAPRKR